jgi:hypothetical protein
MTNVRTVLEGLGLEPNPTAHDDASALAEVSIIINAVFITIIMTIPIIVISYP